jgi:hypothetical protein
MYSRQEHYTDDQIICWNCEEAVHPSAIVCPYCNVEVHRHHVQKISDQQKITPLIQHEIASTEPSRNKDTSESAHQTLPFLCSLFFLLSGSALFFLAVIIAFFARDGVFTVSWEEHTWSAFFGLGLFLLAFGMLFMQRLSDVAEES